MVAKATAVEQSDIEWFLAQNESGTERWVDRGVRHEYPLEFTSVQPGGEIVSLRNRTHSRICANLARLLGNWNLAQPEPRGEVLAGDAGFILSGFPNSTAGADVAYIAAELAAVEFEGTTMIDGCPQLAVEILSPSDEQKKVSDKTAAYLASGVPLVWMVNPFEQTVTVYRPNRKPYLVNSDQELTGDDVLPGFRVSIAQLFS